MTADELEMRIVEWARHEVGLEALILGGSRAHPGNVADIWSDWDIHLITHHPKRYQRTSWLEGIASCWSAHVERTPRGFIKISAVFAEGLEADFLPLASWQMKFVYAAMRYPSQAKWMPTKLKQGIHETRAFMLGSGYRLLVGSEAWARRLRALEILWPRLMLTAEEFERHVSAFWTKSVWIFKKIARPEPRSAMHWLHLTIVHHVYVLLAEEARLEGKQSRTEARKAEYWLNARRLDQTAIVTDIDQKQLARTLLAVMALFDEVVRSVARRRGFAVPDHTAVEAWLREELSRIAS